MATIETPPRFINLPSALAYGDVPKSIFRTAVRLWGLSWRSSPDSGGLRYIGPFGVQDVASLCRVGRSQLYEHLRWLRIHGVLDYTVRSGQVTLTLNPADRIGEGLGAPVSRMNSDMIPAVAVSPPVGTQVTSSNQKKQQQQTRAREALSGLGVTEPTMSQLVDLAWVRAEYVDAWGEWLEGQPPELGLGYIITRMREGDAAPESQAKRDRAALVARNEAYARRRAA